MFESLSVSGYRGLPSIKIKGLRRVNLFVGRNNAGKSSLLEAFFLASNPINPALAARVNQFRGLLTANNDAWRTLFCLESEKQEIEISSKLGRPEVMRHVVITPIKKSTVELSKSKTLLLGSERDDSDLTEKNDDGQGFPFGVGDPQFEGLEFSLSVQKPSSDEQTFKTRLIDRGGKLEATLPTEGPQMFRGVFVSPATRGVGIVQGLNEVQVEKGIPDVVEALSLIEPSLVDIALGANGSVFVDVGYDRLLPLNSLGSGVLKMLAVVLAFRRARGGVVLIDEVESGLHYSIQEKLWRVMLEAAERFSVQVLATSHSAECLAALQSATKSLDSGEKIRLFRLERRSAEIVATDYDGQELSLALEQGWEIR